MVYALTYLLMALAMTSRCAAGYCIAGRVANAAGANLSGISVNLLYNGLPLQAVNTDEQGRYFFNDIPPGSYVVEPSRNGVFPSVLGFTPESRTFNELDSNQSDQNFLLPAVTSTPSRNSIMGDTIGSCFDEQERTFYCSSNINPAFVHIEYPTARTFYACAILPGAQGQHYPNDWWLEAADSELDLGTRTGTYQLVVSTNYHCPYFKWARTTFAAPVTRRFWRAWVRRLGEPAVHLTELKLDDTPAPWFVVQGTVRTTSGESIAGALVSAVNAGDHSSAFHATTQADGSYSLRLTAGEYILGASIAGYQPQLPSTRVFPSAQGDLNFPLEPLPAFSNAFYVLVNATLIPSLQKQMQTYTNDVAQQGYQPVVLPMFADTCDRLRTVLQAAYGRGMVGCVLVGDFPIAWWKEAFPGGQYCASDLFYMDLDGAWADSDGDDCYDQHTGRRGADIFLGRLTASNLKFAPLDNEVDLLKNYFRKVHQYRLHELRRPVGSACLFVDQDWAHCTPFYRSWIDYAYNDITQVVYPESTGDNYRRCLTNDYELLEIHSHASPGGHALDNGLSSAEVRALDPHPLFYVIWGCSAADYRADNYLAGWYPFSASSALLAVGETFSAGIAGLEYLYQPLAQGESWGETWRRKKSPDGINILSTEPYAESLLGDPTLRIQSTREPLVLTLQASLQADDQVRISWRAITRSHANLKYYDLQYRSQGPTPAFPDEPWTSLLTNSSNSTCLFPGVSERTYWFRCRVSDYAGNTGPYLESSAVQIPIRDLDGNSLPDWWEIACFGAVGVRPEADPDLDGASNSQEYTADTDPLDCSDKFRILSCQWTCDPSGSRATVSWTSKQTRIYRLLQCGDISAPSWSPTSLELIPGDSSTTTRMLTNLPPEQRFFRVMVLPPVGVNP